jgi:uncharacterized protein (TIGR00162 family)
MSWKIEKLSNEKISNPILIEGLPGIGNVGKIATDFIVDKLKAKKIFEITSYKFPHCVFVNEKNLVELPTIEIYHKKVKNKSFLFLVGDVQPMDEYACYEFCDKILDLFQQHKGKEIITLGGIAIEKVPKHPKVYCAGTSQTAIKKYKNKYVAGNLSEIVGPIIGVSGLLIGLAGKRKISAVSLLAETFAHPNYFGVRSAQEILKVINLKFNLNLKIKELENELIEVEKEVKTSKKAKRIIKAHHHHTSYIG